MNVIAKTDVVQTTPVSALMDPAQFSHMVRVGQMLAVSPLFPEHLRKGGPDVAAANGALVMNMAVRLGEDPLTIAQNIYFVSGKPGWSASYMIGKANQHGVFEGTIAWEKTGEDDDLSVTAFAILKSTGQRVETTASMAMAKAEGWTKNPKYKSMPVQMLSYRSATALIRLYCPEVMVGVPTITEVEDSKGMKDVTPTESLEPVVTEKKTAPVEADPVEAETIDATSEPVQEDAPAQETQQTNTPDPAQFASLFEMIKADLLEAPSVDDVLELYDAQIKQMETAAPNLFAELQSEIKAYREQ